MSEHRTARLHLDGATGGTVEIDGTDISHTVQGVTLTARVGHVPVLHLDLVLRTADVDGEVVAVIPQDTAAALIALGWTPPGTQLASARERVTAALRDLAPGHPVRRVWGRREGAAGEQAQEGNAWAADVEDLADLVLRAVSDEGHSDPL